LVALWEGVQGRVGVGVLRNDGHLDLLFGLATSSGPLSFVCWRLVSCCVSLVRLTFPALCKKVEGAAAETEDGN
jgi:hypothetical protein